MKEIIPLIHIGHPKTASTWLQSYFLNNRELGFISILDQPSIFQYIIYPKTLYFDPEKARSAINFQSLEGLLATPTISQELLGGHPSSVGFDNATIANRLKKIFPIARILLVIKEQTSMIFSNYNEYILNGGCGSITDFIQAKKQSSFFRHDLRFYEYHRLIGHYYTLFGKENVLVLTFEDFQSNHIKFCNQILEFTGNKKKDTIPNIDITLNKGTGSLAINALSKVNHFLCKEHFYAQAGFRKYLTRGLDRIIPNKLHNSTKNIVINKIEQMTRTFFEESNQKTIALTGLALDTHGYKI